MNKIQEIQINYQLVQIMKNKKLFQSVAKLKIIIKVKEIQAKIKRNYIIKIKFP
jgi:hypothetical protein